MNRSLTSRRWLFAWVIILGFMTLAAWTIRDARFKALARTITAELTPLAEEGIQTEHFDNAGNLLYTENDYLWEHQGPMVWLIEHGYRDPAMLRVMLLCEARRTKDEVYLYPRCWNWDLREHLIAECRREFPEDPLVAWAIGCCYLAAGEYENAAIELLAARVLRFDPAAAGVSPEHFIHRIITAQLMNGMPEGAVEFAAGLVEDDPSAENYWIYADLLCGLEKYPEAIAAADAGLAGYPENADLLSVKFRSLWWLGEITAANELYVSHPHISDNNATVDENDYRNLVSNGNLGDFDYETYGSLIPVYGAVAEYSAITGDPAQLAVVEDHIARRRSELAARAGGTRPGYDPDWLDYAELELLRAYVLTRQWAKLASALAPTARPGWGMPAGSYQTAVLLSSIAQTGSPPPEVNPYWDFQELIEGGTLPYLLYSSHFAAAAEHAGRDVDEVRAEVIAAFMPVRETYRDWTNGELDW